MDIKVGDLLKLSDNKDYFVVALDNQKNSIYYCLACINDVNFKVIKLNCLDECLELIDKVSLSSELILKFTDSYKSYLHKLNYNFSL